MSKSYVFFLLVFSFICRNASAQDALELPAWEDDVLETSPQLEDTFSDEELIEEDMPDESLSDEELSIELEAPLTPETPPEVIGITEPLVGPEEPLGEPQGDEVQSVTTEKPEALKPLSSQQELKGRIRIAPESDSPAIRELKETDRVTVLRSMDDWFEVDVESAEGLIFRGWVKGQLPEERKAPPPPELLPEGKAAKPQDYFIRKDFSWFFTGGIEQAFQIRLGAGLQSLKTSWKGRFDTPDPSNPNPPSSSLTGIDAHLGLNLDILQWQNKWGQWTSGSRVDYHLGHYQVNFASDASIPVELRGDAYKVRTHRLNADLFQRLKRPLNSKWAYHIEAGLGAFYFESSPDLREGTNEEVIFTQLDMTSPLLRLQLALYRGDQWKFSADTGILILPFWSETPSDLSPNDLSRSGIPLWLRLNTEYSISSMFGVFGMLEGLSLKASEAGPSSRNNASYPDGVSLKLESLRLLGGITFKL